MAEEAVPKEFLCPITSEIMVDPVMGPDGVTYERSAVEQWLKRSTVSPVTRLPLSADQLVPNRVLKGLIDAYKTEHGMPVAEPKPAPKSEDTATSFVQPESGVVSLSFTSTHLGQRTPHDVCCIVDVSGSMGALTNVPGGGKDEVSNYTVLDIVRHGVRTVAHSLIEGDRLSIITFDDYARMLCPPMPIDDAVLERVDKKLDSMQPGGSTNLWDGLHLGLATLNAHYDSSRHVSVMLFTDGQSNKDPPEGVLRALQHYNVMTESHIVVNTFGFGYATLDSKLLTQIAVENDGMFTYIPDAGFIGTGFINSLANEFCVRKQSVSLVATAKDGVSIDVTKSQRDAIVCRTKSNGGLCRSIAADRIEFDLGQLRAGQTFDIVFYMNGVLGSEVPVNFTLHYAEPGQKSPTVWDMHTYLEVIAIGEIPRTEVAKRGYWQLEKNMAMARLADAMELMCSSPGRSPATVEDVQKMISVATDRMRCSPLCDSRYEPFDALLKDFTGEITNAVSRYDWYERWGRHYLRSLQRAHLLEICSNFKDPGVQPYAGKDFTVERDRIDSIFRSLPRPIESGKYAGAVAVTSMSQFNNPSAGCIDGAGVVILKSGATKMVKDLKRGDVLADGGVVRCLVCYEVENGYERLCSVGSEGALLTENHPVLFGGVWRRAYEVASATCSWQCSFVFNVLLEPDEHRSGCIGVCGVACATLGQRTLEDSSELWQDRPTVEAALARFVGWEEGYVYVHRVVRDDKTKGAVEMV